MLSEAMTRSATGVLLEVAEAAAAALEELEVAVVGDVDDDGSLGG